MSNAWDISNIRRLAGLQATQLTESWHDDDDNDEDPDATIASEDKRQKAFERRNKKDLNAPPAPKKAAEEKKSEPKATPAEEKKEEAKAEAKRRGKAPNPESFNQQAKSKAGSMTRKEFLKWASETHGKGTAYSSALFAKYNPKSGRAPKEEVKECFVLVHPFMKSYLLAENYELNQMQWIDTASSLEPLVFETQAEADKTAKYMAEWKGQAAVVQKIVFED
jgi:DNA mismatch repair ATPase MutL